MSKTDPKLDAAVPIEIEFLADAQRGLNLYLTGVAGTGKSTLLRKMIRAFTGELDPFEDAIIESWEWPKKEIHVTASTGIAALNVQGATIHRFAGIGIGPPFGTTIKDFCADILREPTASQRQAIRRIVEADIVVIDEISMLPGAILELLDYWFRLVRGVPGAFGGIQMILIGDFLQLPPVRTSETTPYDWAFRAPAWTAGNFRAYELKKIWRQSEPDFIHALGSVREGKLTGIAASVLHARVKSNPSGSIVRLMTHNNAVDKWNGLMLEDIDAPPTTYMFREEGHPNALEMLRKGILAPDELIVKEGARVMLLVNNYQPGQSEPEWVNGETGTVTECGKDFIVVESDRDRTLVAGYYIWYSDWNRLKKIGKIYREKKKEWLEDNPGEQVSPYEFNPMDRVPEPLDGGPPLTWHSQIPVRLAYAATIHKSQGQTLDSAYIDIRAAREPGQAYVALSRVRTLAGLLLKEYPSGLFFSPEARDFHRGISGLKPFDMGRALKPTDY